MRSGMGDRFHAEAKKNPAKIALHCGAESVAYGELDRDVTRLAQWLLRAGLRPGDRVGIFWFNEIPAVTLYLACFRAGLIALPVIWRMKASELSYILGHAKPAVFFSHPKLAAVADEAQQSSGHTCRIFTALPTDLPEVDEAKLPPIETTQPALIIYTSGTTARPKGVTHTHRTLGAAVEIMWGLGGNGVSVTTTSIMHPSGLYCIVLPSMMAGDTVVLVPVFDPMAVLDAIERHRCTSCIFLPSMAQFAVVEQMKKPRVVNSMQWIIAGGDSVPVALQKQFQAAFGVPLREGIAMTECCPMLANPVDAMRLGSVGLPMRYVEARVVNNDGRPIPDGEIGELSVRSPCNFTGYWNNPEETAAALRDGWLFTGDLVRRDAEGYFWFQGRKKQIIVRESYNIAPQEVEEVLYKNPAVLEAGVIGMPDPIFGEKVVAYVSLRPGQTATEAELREFARQHLNDLKVPEKILFLAELPKGLSGKVDRRALKEMAQP